MATTTLSTHKRAVRSSVAIKALMAVTGLLLVAFLLMHMYGNLKVFMGADAFDHYAEWLKTDILYPLLPKGSFIWVFRLVLLAAVVLHICSAVYLWHKSAKARGSKYQHVTRKVQTYAARTMRWGGVILGLGLLFHLLQFTVKATPVGFDAADSPYSMFVNSFSNWYVWIIYALWLVAVCMHIRHGFWSAFTTLGANLSKRAEQVLNGLAYFVAILLYVGFMLPPTVVLLQLVPFGG